MNILPHTSSEIEDVKKFLRANYGANFYGANNEYFNWLYLQSPCRWFQKHRDAGLIPVNSIRQDNGDIGALQAFVPFDLLMQNDLGRGAWDLEWINASGIRGAGRALAKHLLAEVDIYAGYGCNDLSATAFKNMGMTLVPEISRGVFVFAPETLGTLIREAGGQELEELQGGNGIGKKWIKLENTQEIAKECFEEYTASMTCGVTRSREWLSWRFDNHPFIDYAIVAPYEDARAGSAILRIESILGTNETVARIVDLFPGKHGVKNALGAAIGFARDHGCTLADYFCTDFWSLDTIAEASRELGENILLNPHIPFRFQPLEVRGAHSINLVVAHGGQSNKSIPLSAFHATKADANQDILRNPDHSAQSDSKK